MTKINGNLFNSIINGSATPDNKGLSRIVNGTQVETDEGIEFRGGIKHIVAETLYRNSLKSYLDAIKKGEIEKAAEILKKVPKALQGTFYEYAGLTDMFIKGEAADKKLSKISALKEKASDLIADKKKPDIQIIMQEEPETHSSLKTKDDIIIVDTEESDNGQSAFVPEVVIISDEEEAPLSASEQLDKMAKGDTLMAYVIELYRQDGASDIRILNRLEGKNERYYRFIGQEEFEKLMSGEKVTSTRPYHKGVYTDVTSDSEYSGIPTMHKYRVAFKDKKEFNPTLDKGSRIIDKDFGKAEFLLGGGYTLDDIEKIERKTDKEEYELIWTSKDN